MIELGKKQTLLVVKSVEFGVYLAEDMNADTNRFRQGQKQEINWKFLFIKILRIV